MSKIFTDETGMKWELDEEFTDFLKSRDSSGGVVVKPVVEEAPKMPEYKVDINFTFDDKSGHMKTILPTIVVRFNTYSQAEAVAASIKALMEYIQDPASKWTDTVSDKALEAWKLLQEGK
jgi:hypothetical protein